MLLSDIDGTLRPFSSPVIPDENVRAIHAIQSIGVKFAISTGRSRSTIPAGMLNGILPDFWICAGGAQILAGDGSEISVSRMPPEKMDAITEFCAARNCPLRFVFSDGIYIYSGYEEYQEWAVLQGFKYQMADGTDRKHHLTEMPFAASALLPDPMIEDFCRIYPGAGLRFPSIYRHHRDILWGEQSKASGLETLLKICGFSMEECVSVGDGENDVEILAETGMSYCVEHGSPQAMAAAHKICPSAEEFGVAAVCRELWPEAFG